MQDVDGPRVERVGAQHDVVAARAMVLEIGGG